MDEKREFTGTWIPAHIILDTELNELDKIIYAEIASFKECYFTNKQLAERYKKTERTIQRSISRLKQKGYIIQSGFTGRNRILQAVYDQPRQKCHPCHDKNVTPAMTKMSPKDNNIDNNKDINNINKLVTPSSENQTTENQTTINKDIAEIIKAFEEINPTAKTYYGNKTQREATRQLLEIYGKEKVLKAIQLIKARFGAKYYPTITTPNQLLHKFSQLINAYQREQQGELAEFNG